MNLKIHTLLWAFLIIALEFPLTVLADTSTVIDTGATAWMLTASTLLAMMYLPGLAMFYGGMVRSKNVLSIFTQLILSAGIIGVLFVVYGYSLMLDMTGASPGHITIRSFIGGLDKAFLAGIDTGAGAIPEGVMIMFLMMFAIISPAVVVGGFAERIKFSSAILFLILWFTFAYLPMAHMVWAGPGALLADWGALDFAGGTAVHINTGVAALVAAIMVGKRKYYLKAAMPPHNLVMTLVGGGLLWVGWFAFNVGSGMAVDAKVGTTLLNTQLGACGGVIAWAIIERVKLGHVSALGVISGAIAGLVGITPGCAFVGTFGAILIGMSAGVVCFIGVTSIKQKFGYDDTLDVFGIHGLGGIVGALMTGILASDKLGGHIVNMNITHQFLAQSASVLFTIFYSVIITWIILKLIDLTVGLRDSDEVEEQGLDISQHNERAYNP
ncbi:ammonium transporter [Methylophilus glucosoxydans]|uniref:Ammonium transporter n=1 Tax=Methylophilus glucosoxydans TaxID=752553 RepID=A0ABW3GEB1_9PROT|nr:ammonium transporter [Methylophilus sp. 13]MBF5040180.1 ammonium transporter [Methylophilus sp. 13]